MWQSSFKLREPRKFSYQPRYYKPAGEEKRILFKRLRKSQPAKKGSVLRLGILFVFLALLFFYLQKRAAQAPDTAEQGTRTITVEEVIVID
jgi:hypothetical protein